MQEPIRVCQVVGNMNGGGVEQVVMQNVSCILIFNSMDRAVE